MSTPSVFYHFMQLFGYLDQTLWSTFISDEFLICLANQNSLRKVSANFETDIEAIRAQGLLLWLANLSFASQEANCNEVLSSLIIKNPNVSDRGLLVFAEKVTSLRTLQLINCPGLSDLSVLRLLQANCELSSIHIVNCDKLSVDSCFAIARFCNRITHLTLKCINSYDDCFVKRIASRCCSLTSLDVSDNPNIVSDSTLKTISMFCKRLTSLNVCANNKISDVGVLSLSEHLKHLTRLLMLRTDQAFRVTDVSLLSLSERCRLLTTINLSGNSFISDLGIEWLSSGCLCLQDINVKNCDKLTDTALKSLGENCLSLTHVNISNCSKISNVGISALGSSCVKLVCLKVNNLNLLNDSKNRTSGAEGLKSLLVNCTKIQVLSANNCSQCSSGVLKALACVHSFTKLEISRFNINDKDLRNLVSSVCCKTLNALNVSHCENLTGKSLVSVGNACPNLKSLNFSHCLKVSSRAIVLFAQQQLCFKLEKLNLESTGLDELSLYALSSASFGLNMSWLNIANCGRLTDTVLVYLSQRMKNLVYFNVKGCDGISEITVRHVLLNWSYVKIVSNKIQLGFVGEESCKEMRFADNVVKQIQSLVKLQSVFRRVLSKLSYKQVKSRYLKYLATIRLQNFARMLLAKLKLNELKLEQRCLITCCIKIQCTFRKYKAKQLISGLRQNHVLEQENKAARFVQNIFRQKRSRNILNTLRAAAYSEEKLRIKTAIRIQRNVRMVQAKNLLKAKKAYRLIFQRKEIKAAIQVQQIFRKSKAKQELERRKAVQVETLIRKARATRMLQCCVRKKLAYKKLVLVRELKRRELNSVIQLQSLLRVRFSRNRLNILKAEKLKQIQHESATKIQGLFRTRQTNKIIKLLERARTLEEERKLSAVIMIQRLAKRTLARTVLKLLALKKRDMILEQEAALRNSAILIQKNYRGKVGRRLASLKREEKLSNWKAIFDDNEQRVCYFNAETGEIRFRRPQVLLDILPKPLCLNCQDYKLYYPAEGQTTTGKFSEHDNYCGSFATVECKDCSEFYCHDCWYSVHFGGKRKFHESRQLYDFYGKRLDNGELQRSQASVWPSELHEDEFSVVAKRISEKEASQINAMQKVFTETDQTQSLPNVTAREKSMETVNAKWTKHWNQIDDLTYQAFFYDNETGESRFERPAEYFTPRNQDDYYSQN